MNTQPVPFYARLAYVMVGIIAVGYLAVLGKEILAPLVFSLLFAVLLLPLAGFMERKCRFSRGAAAGVSVLLLISLIFLLMYVLGSQLAALATDWPSLEKNVTETVTLLQNWVEHTFHIDTAKQLTYLDTALRKLLSSSTVVIGATVVSVSSIVLFNVFILLYTFFLLLYRRLLLKFIVTVFADTYTIIVYDIVEQVKYIIGKYVVGLFLEMFIVIVISCIIFWMLGASYPFLLGLLTGILNVIPYVGIFTALLLSALITFATGGATQTIYVVISMVIVHLIDSNYIMPKVVGSKVKINPLVVILGVLIGHMMRGISGMFLAVPVIAIMKVIFDRVEGLKPWGVLLGDEEKVPRKKKPLAAGGAKGQ